MVGTGEGERLAAFGARRRALPWRRLRFVAIVGLLAVAVAVGMLADGGASWGGIVLVSLLVLWGGAWELWLTVHRLELTPTSLRWWGLLRRGEVPLAGVRLIHSGFPLPRHAMVGIGGAAPLWFRIERGTEAFATAVRAAAPHVRVTLGRYARAVEHLPGPSRYDGPEPTAAPPPPEPPAHVSPVQPTRPGAPWTVRLAAALVTVEVGTFLLGAAWSVEAWRRALRLLPQAAEVTSATASQVAEERTAIHITAVAGLLPSAVLVPLLVALLVPTVRGINATRVALAVVSALQAFCCVAVGALAAAGRADDPEATASALERELDRLMDATTPAWAGALESPGPLVVILVAAPLAVAALLFTPPSNRYFQR